MQQYVFPLSHHEKYHPDEFIVSSSNRLAYNALRNWSVSFGVNPYRYSLLISGNHFSGKTYLAKIWQQLTNGYIIKDIFFDEEILLQHNAFIIENIENWQERALLHIFNLINEQHKYLLLTTANKNKKIILADLESRIKSLLTIEIDVLDDELMKILIFKHFSSASVILSQSIIDYLLITLPRNQKVMLELLEKINNFALISKRRITIPLIKEVLDHETNYSNESQGHTD